MTPQVPHFNGADYDRDRDDARLANQLRRIHALMIDGQWRTLSEIAAATGDPPASISAQLRHLRKPRFGGHIVDKDYLGRGLYQYRVLKPEPNGQIRLFGDEVPA